MGPTESRIANVTLPAASASERGKHRSLALAAGVLDSVTDLGRPWAATGARDNRSGTIRVWSDY